MKKLIPVKGMHCVSCEKLILSELKDLKGVEEVDASFPNETVEVTFNEKKITLDQITEKISELGYSALGKEGKRQDKGFVKNLAHALIPHTGCFAFIIITIFGVTGAAVFLRPLMMNANFFYILIALSFLMTTVSVVLYLKKNRILSLSGLKRKWRYTSVMYGITIGVNLLLLFVIFPYTANIGSGPTGMAILEEDYSSILLSVAIPCPGHAPLISGDLKTIEGVDAVRFSMPDNFEVFYDSSITNKDEILSLEVFDTYPATFLSSSGANEVPQSGPTGNVIGNSQPSSGGCGCGSTTCGGSSSCCG
ncbi:MAG: hypothetical protein GOV02_03295 [Candidatus Aenigmarchaeota archaeon]|nr:hypothetical protein [Candidatus Aenigmarchaeota archaeon]